MKREHIYFDQKGLKFGAHITHMIQLAMSSGKKFFMWNEQIYLLTANYGAEETGLTMYDIVD